MVSSPPTGTVNPLLAGHHNQPNTRVLPSDNIPDRIVVKARTIKNPMYATIASQTGADMAKAPTRLTWQSAHFGLAGRLYIQSGRSHIGNAGCCQAGEPQKALRAGLVVSAVTARRW